jgi:prolyl-tRNA synthetase
MIKKATGAPRGFAGAVNIKTKVIADYSIMNMINFVTGANKQDYHLKNVNAGRDFQVEAYTDLRVVEENDSCPRCAGKVKFARGIEVGHVFKLGTKYSKAMKAAYLDKDGQEKTMIMGCYGIGIGRTVAACIEQNYDDQGIVWPVPLAPYHVIITPVNVNDKSISDVAENLYNKMQDEKIEVILDDRDERAGVKFNDADLIGIPLRVVIGQKNLAQNKVELKIRKTGENKLIAVDEIVNEVKEFVNKAFSSAA